MAAPKLLLLTQDLKEVTTLSKYLHGLAWVTLWSRTVKDAIKSFDTQQIDAVMVGSEILGEDPADSIAKMRASWPDVRIVLFVDGVLTKELLSTKKGCDKLLRRPFNDDELDLVVAEVTPYDTEKAGWAKVLVVEDGVTVRRLIDQGARKVGLRPAFVESMEQGIEAMKKYTFDCVVTDIFMPGIGGIGGIMQIRKSDKTTPIVAISGGCQTMGYEEVLRAAAAIGADRCLAKPFSPQQFAEAIREAMAARAGAAEPEAATG